MDAALGLPKATSKSAGAARSAPRFLKTSACSSTDGLGIDVAQGVAELDARRPARRALELARIADRARNLGGSHQSRIFADFNRNARDIDEAAQNLAHLDRGAAADVVNLAGRAAVGQRDVRADDVAHVEKIALALDVADVQRPLLAGGDAREAMRERRHCEARILAGADMVESAADDGIEPVAVVIAQHERFAGGFARGVRIGR